MPDKKTFCENCGQPLPPDARFCETCGQAVSARVIASLTPSAIFGTCPGSSLPIVGRLFPGIYLCATSSPRFVGSDLSVFGTGPWLAPDLVAAGHVR